MAGGAVVHFLERFGACKTFDIIHRSHEKITDRGGREQRCSKANNKCSSVKGMDGPSPTTDGGQPSKSGTEPFMLLLTTSCSSCLASGTLGTFLFASNFAASCPRLGLEDCVPRDCSFRS